MPRTVMPPHGYVTHAHASLTDYPQPVLVVVVVVVPQQRGVYRAGWRHADCDGIPNRYEICFCISYNRNA